MVKYKYNNFWNLEIFWPVFTSMKTSKEKLSRKKMGNKVTSPKLYIIKLLDPNLKKERKLFEMLQFPKPMVLYI